MEITINTGKHYHPQSNKTESSKTLTAIMACIVGILVICAIGYAIYAWKNKPDTKFHPVENKKIRQLLQDAKDVTPENIKKKGGESRLKRVFKRLKKECNDKKLLDDQGDILKKYKAINLSKPIQAALKNGNDAQDKIGDFMELKRTRKKNEVTKEAFNNCVHEIIKTPADKSKEPPTDEQIQSAHKQLTDELNQAQEAWSKGKEPDDMSYETKYVLSRLVEEYTRLKPLVEDAEKPKQ